MKLFGRTVLFGYFCQKQINHLDNFLNIGNYEQTVYMYQL